VDRRDVVAMVKQDHASINAAFAQLVRRGDSVPELFSDVAARLIRHEVAEEIALYPALQGVHDGKLAEPRFSEQSEIERRLYRLERVGFDQAVLQPELADLWSTVFEHSEREEAEVLPLVAVAHPQLERIELGRLYARVRDTAPNRPRPQAGAEPVANTIIGPLAALADWIRDCARGSVWQAS
jgi:hypothetical protein